MKNTIKLCLKSAVVLALIFSCASLNIVPVHAGIYKSSAPETFNENGGVYECDGHADCKVTGVKDTQLDKSVVTIAGKTLTKADVSGKHRLYLFFSPLCSFSSATIEALVKTDYNNKPDVKIILFTDFNYLPEGYVSKMGIENYDIVLSAISKVRAKGTDSEYRPGLVFVDPNDNVYSVTAGPRDDDGFFDRIYGYQDITGLSFNKSICTVGVSSISTLDSTITPSTASNKYLRYTSSDETIATAGWGEVKGLKPGTVTITASTYNNIIATCTVNVVDMVSMYRIYNPNSGEHFYTSNIEEDIDLELLGWMYEGIGWYAPSSSNTPVYRLYNPNAGEHHYTSSAGERDMLTKAGWNYEGIGWYSDDAKTVPLYRQYNPNAFSCNHNYTTNKGENDSLVSIGWQAEGIAWYGCK